MVLTDLLEKRRSVRQFAEKAIPPDVVEAIVEAGRLAPSGGNEQPWKFGIITDRELMKDIADIACRQKWIAGAAFLVVLCTCAVEDERRARDIHKARFPAIAGVIDGMERDVYIRLNAEEHQTKIPGTQMILAAWEQGIGSAWISRFAVDALAQRLRLPPGCLPSEIIAFGYPAGEGSARPKKSREEVVFYNEYK